MSNRIIRGSILVAITLLAGCYYDPYNTRATVGVHGYYNSAYDDFYFYPDVGIYFDIGSGYYYYRPHDTWIRVRTLPSHIHLDPYHRVKLHLDRDHPYRDYRDHYNRYRFDRRDSGTDRFRQNDRQREDLRDRYRREDRQREDWRYRQESQPYRSTVPGRHDESPYLRHQTPDRPQPQQRREWPATNDRNRSSQPSPRRGPGDTDRHRLYRPDNGNRTGGRIERPNNEHRTGGRIERPNNERRPGGRIERPNERRQQQNRVIQGGDRNHRQQRQSQDRTQHHESNDRRPLNAAPQHDSGRDRGDHNHFERRWLRDGKPPDTRDNRDGGH